MRSLATAARGAALCAALGAVLGTVPAQGQQTAPIPGTKPAQGVARQSQPTIHEKDSAEASMPADAPAGAAAPRAPRPGEMVAIVPGADPGSILSAARVHGDARLVADDYGDPRVEAIADGRPYDITFYDCTDNRNCQSVMLRGAFRAKGQTASQMAAWNRGERFGKAYLDEQGNPIIEMNLNLAGGVTQRNLSDSFERWETVLSGFAEHVGY